MGFDAPQRLGTLTGAQQLCVATNTDGRLEVFATTASKTLQHIWQNKPNSDWSNWETIGNASGEVHAVQGDGGRIAVFAVTEKGLGYWYQDQAGKGPWHGPVIIGPATVTHFGVIRNQNGLLEVVAVENAKFAFHATQNQANLAASWAGLQPIWPSTGNTGTPR